jgi:predicted esterase
MNLQVQGSRRNATKFFCIAMLLTPAIGFAFQAHAVGQDIKRILPPQGRELSPAESAALTLQLAGLVTAAEKYQSDPLFADVACLLKAVDFAIRHAEFYGAADVKKATAIMDLAQSRIDELTAGTKSWTTARGLVVRGYSSSIDGSPQPYGLVIPEDLDLAVENRLYVWLHGRGDKTTDLHFIDQRMKSKGQVAPANAIVVHPFGRQCIGFKSAGEIDVLEVVDHVASQYGIDRSRVVLMGFSMGGAGAWHLGAHYADQWVAMSPGAGFAETALYNRLKQADYPAWYERTLWTNYDVPNYTRNLFNLPVVAYSGEVDKQIQAARVMEGAFREHGRELTHLIGPGMGHKYHPDVLKEILNRMQIAAEKGLDPSPRQVSLQTRTLRYSKVHWLQATKLKSHWQDSRADGQVIDDSTIRITTQNVTALAISFWDKIPQDAKILIDDQTLALSKVSGAARVELIFEGEWAVANSPQQGLVKRPGVQGPMDDVFLTPFLVVTPSRSDDNAAVQDWLTFEIEHLKRRWPALFRGELPIKSADAVTAEDLSTKSLVLWGTPESNEIMRRAMTSGESHSVPLKWKGSQIELDGRSYSGDHLVPAMVYPSPWSSDRYVLINSGPTFREGHDRTNSLQNPKLPDWAVFDIRTPPSQTAAAGVVDAGFFDESWRMQRR